MFFNFVRVFNKLLRVGLCSGKLGKMRQIFFDTLFILKTKYGVSSPFLLCYCAILNVKPLVEVRRKKVVSGIASDSVYITSEYRRFCLGIRWLIHVARNRKGKGIPFSEVFANELFLASQCQGEAFKKKSMVHQTFCVGGFIKN